MYFTRRGNLEWRGERARRIHSEWLTLALRGERPLPRIPVRRVDEGGWEELLGQPNGRRICERWWRIALRWVFDLDDDQSSRSREAP